MVPEENLGLYIMYPFLRKDLGGKVRQKLLERESLSIRQQVRSRADCPEHCARMVNCFVQLFLGRLFARFLYLAELAVPIDVRFFQIGKTFQDIEWDSEEFARGKLTLLMGTRYLPRAGWSWRYPFRLRDPLRLLKPTRDSLRSGPCRGQSVDESVGFAKSKGVTERLESFLQALRKCL